MKNILFITYYYPPCNSPGANRTGAWAKYLSENGYKVIVVTRYWDGTENNKETYISNTNNSKTISVNENLKVYYLPFISKQNKTKLSAIINVFKGNFDIEYDTNGNFYNKINEIIRKEPIDLIITSAPPINTIKLTSRIYKQTKIPFIIDFRDLWDNNEMSSKNVIAAKNKIINSFYRYYINKWVKKSKGLISVSKPFVEYISEKFGISNVEVIINGYLIDYKKNNSKTKQFTISSIGKIYDRQEYKILLNGIASFIKSKNNESIMVNFIGISKTDKIYNDLIEIIPKNNLLIKERIQKLEADKYMLNSDVLIYSGWKMYSGIFSSKIFEYLASRKNIIIAPSDNDVIDELLKQTKSGVSLNTENEVREQLNLLYNEWLNNGFSTYVGIEKEIEKYSASKQVSKLIKFIEK